ncbi:hypothetical protein D3C73_1128900 [compost metagenome]
MDYIANILDVTTSYVSAVELGKRPVPEEWIAWIIYIYDLDRKQGSELREAALEASSQAVNRVKISQLPSEDREIVYKLVDILSNYPEDSPRVSIYLDKIKEKLQCINGN